MSRGVVTRGIVSQGDIDWRGLCSERILTGGIVSRENTD